MERTPRIKDILALCTFMCLSLCLNQALAYKKGGVKMNIESNAFKNGGMIPAKYTCDGADISPSLTWDKIPDGTKSLALICDDPDAPMGTWVHWVYYNIPTDIKGLPEGVVPEERPATGGIQGINDFRNPGYGGPCPPGGTHRYYFRLYALDTLLDLPPGTTKKRLLKAMEGHVLEKTEFMAKYQRR